MAKVFLGIGHGGRDPGAVANGLREADINLTVGLSARAELLRHGVSVGISRIEDENDTLAEEIAEANAFKPDVAVDIHTNAGGGDGFEVYVQTNRFSAQSRTLALAMEAEVKDLGQNSRGVKTKLNAYGTDWFGWVRQVNCPAVLAEGAFLDTADRYFIDTVEEQEALGVAYAKGILAYLGIRWLQPGSGEPDNGKKTTKLQEEIADLKEQLAKTEELRRTAAQNLANMSAEIVEISHKYTV